MENDLSRNYSNLPAKTELGDRKTLLREKESIIEESIGNIQESFIRLGKALIDIKDQKLYKEDPLHNTWKAYIENRVKAKLNQSTIGDYIAIVRMMISNDDISEEDIIKLGYKKAKFLKTKYNTILKEKNDEEREKKLDHFKKIYHEIIESSQNIPYRIYEDMFAFVKKKDKNKQKSNIVKNDINGVKITYNKNKKSISISSEQSERLDTIYNYIVNINTGEETELLSGKLVNISNNLAAFLREIPKTEIHLHIEAIVSVESIYDLIKKNELSEELEISSIDDVRRKFQCSNLNEMVKVFYLIQSVFKNESDFAYLVKDVRNYLLRNNIYYAEVYFSPTKFVQNGLDFNKIINIIDREIKRYYVEDHIDINIIIDVSRNFGLDNAMNNLELVLNSDSDCIIGIGLGGAEALKGAEAENFAPVFKKAKENGLHTVAHAGEVVESESIWQSIELLDIERIGHGISAIYDEELMKYLKDTQIPLEICPTSNVFTQKYVKTLGEHPIKKFFDYGINITLNSDDPSIFGADITDEYKNIYEYSGFSVNQLIKIVKNGLFSTFISDNLKEVYWEGVEEKIKTLKDKFNIKQ